MKSLILIIAPALLIGNFATANQSCSPTMGTYIEGSLEVLNEECPGLVKEMYTINDDGTETGPTKGIKLDRVNVKCDGSAEVLFGLESTSSLKIAATDLIYNSTLEALQVKGYEPISTKVDQNQLAQALKRAKACL